MADQSLEPEHREARRASEARRRPRQGEARRRSSSAQAPRRRSASSQGERPQRRRAPGEQGQRPQARRHDQARRAPQHSGQARRRQKRSLVPFIAGGVVLLALILAIVFIFIYPLRYDVTINGTKQNISRGTTINKLIEEGVVTPNPGNLLAVDGSVIEVGKGEVFSATINGNPTTDGTIGLDKDAVVEVSDGGDLTEEYTETQETIPHGSTTSEVTLNDLFNASLHVYEDGQDGLNVTKTGSISGKTVTEEVTPMVDEGFRIYTADVGEDKVIGLTFDDGPWPETTDEILDLLEQYGAKATFFVIGNQIADYTDQLKRAYDMGCEICTHSWDHAGGSGQGVNLTYMSPSEQIEEVTKGMDAISQAIGAEAPRILRAPGGNFYGDIVANLEPYIDAEIGWDVDTEDWSRPGSDAIYQAIMSVKPGQVILMHDGGGDRSQTVEALSRALPELAAQGYSFVTISDLLAYGH